MLLFVHGIVQRLVSGAPTFSPEEVNQNYRIIAETVRQFLWTTRPDGTLEYCNRYWHSYTGLSWQETQRHWHVALHPDDVHRVMAAWEQARENGKGYEIEYRVRRWPDGTYGWLLGRIFPVRDHRGSIARWVGSAVDIHERKEAELALRESEERYRLMVEGAIEHAIFTLDLSGVVTSWSSGAENLLGYTRQQMVGASGQVIFTAADRRRKEPEHEIRRALIHGRVEEDRLYCRKDKTVFWGNGVVLPLYNKDHKLVCLLKILKDRTQQRLAEETLERYRLVIKNLKGYAIFMLDVQGNVSDWNEGAARIIGYAADEIIGRPVSVFYTNDDKKAGLPNREIARARQKGHSESEGWRVRKDGSHFWASELITPLYDRDRRLIGFTKITRDLSDEKNVRDTLYMLNDSLERRVRERTLELQCRQQQLRALARQLGGTERRERQRIATELHDQLAQLLALSELRLGSLPVDLPDDLARPLADVRQYISEALVCTRALISDLSPAVLHKRDVAAVVKSVADQMKRRGLISSVREDSNPKPMSEETLALVHQAIRELLMNVLKHAGTQRASIRLRTVGNQLEIRVADRGIGFKRTLQRQDPSSEGGFGLFNLRERLTLIGGQLDVQANNGHGTIVILKAPLVDAKPDSGDAATPDVQVPQFKGVRPPGKKIKVLIADDHQIMRDGLRKLIEEQTDMEVLAEAPDGQVAVELARKLKPDVILMDVNMPRLDGIEATRRILTRRSKPPFIVGLSIQEDKEVAAVFRNAGASAYLTKGEPASTLCEVIRRAGSLKSR